MISECLLYMLVLGAINRVLQTSCTTGKFGRVNAASVENTWDFSNSMLHGLFEFIYLLYGHDAIIINGRDNIQQDYTKQPRMVTSVCQSTETMSRASLDTVIMIRVCGGGIECTIILDISL